MHSPLAVALIVSLASQSSTPTDRSYAEQLARTGRTLEAITLFERIVAENPADSEARLWIARLDLRLGRTDDAEALFRSVIREHPTDVDARIGLGATLTRKGEWSDALTVLRDAERDAGENADLFGAFARAYRRAGDDRRALEYFRRAKTLAPDDPDLISGYEATAQAYGHSFAFEGFGEEGSTGNDAASGTLALSVRATPRLHLLASARSQRRTGNTDTTAGGGLFWRVDRATTLDLRAVGGSGNLSLPNTDLSAEVLHYAGVFEIGGAVRSLSYAGVDAIAASPLLSWDPGGRWRTDTRYTYSRSSFEDTGDTSGDSSVMLRETWRGWRRVALNGVYAYGIESFEDLTADRLSSLGGSTLAGGLRISLPSLSVFNLTWEHQWRSNSTTIDRVTLSIVQSIP